MQSIRKILVPTDFIRGSRQAIHCAILLARQFDASLTVAHVVEYPTTMSYVLPLATFVLEKHHTERIESKLAELIPAEVRDSLDYRFVVKAGVVSDELLTIVRQDEMDLVVMGTHGREHLSRWLLGSVAERLLRQLPIPVMTIAHRGEAEPELTASVKFRRILYATDLSEASGAGLAFAYDMARSLDAELKIVHVVSPLRWDYPIHFFPFDVTKERTTLRQELAERLEQSIPDAMKQDPSVSWCLEDGIPWKVILERADTEDSDLIVVSLQGRGKVERALIGATAERVLRGSHRPVLSIPVD